MTDIIVVGEDEVTREIVKRLLHDSAHPFRIIREEPIRGGEIEKKAPMYNALNLPVIMLTDLDTYDCPPSLISDWFANSPISPRLIFRVAYGEAESWLMADTEGFSGFLSISGGHIPGVRNIDRRNPENIEPNFPYKPSLYLMRELARHSGDNDLKQKLTPRKLAKKGPEYNSALRPFIRNDWNIDAAARNSYSLRKAVKRIDDFRE
jgi:hypothetical protein